MGESSKVRMEISREMHKWFKSIDAKTNDERMQRVIDVNEEYKDLLVKFRKLEIICKQRGEALLSASRFDFHYKNEEIRKSLRMNRALKVLLGLSMAVSIISVGYLAYVQGWLA